MKKIIRLYLISLILLLSNGIAYAQANPADSSKQVSEEVARSYASQKNYTEAIRQYEELIQTMPTSTNYYNLGVCYGQVGRTKDAIIAYERALYIDPSLQEARYNVQLAYTSTKDALGDGRSFTWIDDICYVLRIETLQITACSLFALFMVCSLLLWVSRRQGLVRRSQITFAFGILVLILWLINIAMIAHQIYYHRLGERRAILNQTQELKPTPTGQGNTISTLHEGTAVFLEGNALGHFQEVSLADGRRGYLPIPTMTLIVPRTTRAE